MTVIGLVAVFVGVWWIVSGLVARYMYGRDVSDEETFNVAAAVMVFVVILAVVAAIAVSAACDGRCFT